MKHKALILLISLIEIFSVSKFFACTQFLQHFSAFDLSLRLIEGIHADKGQPLLITRIFHNKLLYGTLDVFNLYLKFIDVSFLTKFISLIGLAGVILGVYYFLISRQKPLYLWTLLSALIFVPFIGIFDYLQRNLQIVVIAAPYILFSLYGFYEFLKKPNRKKYLLIILLTLLSVWIIAANGDALNQFCPTP